MLSDYCKKIAEEYEIKVGDVEKLIPSLGNKTNYVLHYRKKTSVVLLFRNETDKNF